MGDGQAALTTGVYEALTHSLDMLNRSCNNTYTMARASRTITETLRSAIAGSHLSFKALERETGVKRQSLMKFARGEQSLRLDIADRLADYFGIEVKRKRR